MGFFNSLKSTLNDLAEDAKKSLEDSGISSQSLGFGKKTEEPTAPTQEVTPSRPVAPVIPPATSQAAVPPPAPASSVPPPPPAMPKISYYAMVGGQQQGPFDGTQFDQLVKSNQITPDSFVWTEGMAQWAKASAVDELSSFFRPTMPPPPPGSVPPPPPGSMPPAMPGAQRSGNGMFSPELEQIIDAALADGVLTDKERAVLQRRAMAEGIDPDEFDVIIEGRLAKTKKAEDWLRPAPPQNLNGKFGGIQKCPSCGAQVVGGSAVCKECGYNFSGIAANSSAERLSAQLVELTQKAKTKSVFGTMAKAYSGAKDPRAVLIETFAVPNTREDLLEFLSSIQPKATKPTFFTKGLSRGDLEKELEFAYWKLYANCINKARISYASDPDFKFFFEDFDKRK